MKRIVILAIVLAIIIAGWSAAWLYAAGIIRQNVTELANADGQTTPKLTCARLDVGGYPFWFDVTCGSMTVVSGDLTANVAEVKGTVLVYDPWHALVLATGPATLADAFSGSKQRLDWQKLEASARVTDWRIGRISVLADALVLNDTVAGDTLLGKAGHAEFHLLDIPNQHDTQKHLAGLAVYAKADDLNAPGFQINAGKSTLEAEISGLSDDVRTYGDPDIVKRWQAAGGKVTLVGLKGDDGADNFAVTGNLNLDAAYRPAGQLTIGSKGLVERFGSMVPDQWRGLVLGSPATDGSYHQVLTLTNGLILSGLIPLGTLPPLM
ncbi:MAG: DUF2125 domain-containing protein [Devosia sp.]